VYGVHIVPGDGKELTMTAIHRVLVCGASGRQGGAVSRALLAHGFEVLALTRSPQTAAAKELERLGAQVVVGDLSHPVSLHPIMKGVDAVFSVQNYWERGVAAEGELRQAENLLAAAEANGVRHVVQSIMAQAGTYDGIAHFESKQRIADRLRLGPLPFTTLGTVWFMDNILDPKMGGSLTLPILAGSLTSHVSFPMLATADIGKACVKILQSPSVHAGKHFDLIGDRLTVAEMKQVYARVTGRRAKWYRMPRWVMRWINKEFAEQLAWHNRVDFDGQPDQLREWLGETVTFEQFLRQHQNIKL
jgi:uncharacterized protein YbjT (DUF2867 family)